MGGEDREASALQEELQETKDCWEWENKFPPRKSTHIIQYLRVKSKTICMNIIIQTE